MIASIYCSMIFEELNPINFDKAICEEAIQDCLFDDHPNYCLSEEKYEEITRLYKE